MELVCMPKLDPFYLPLCPVCSCEGERPVAIHANDEDEWLCVQCGCWALRLLGSIIPLVVSTC